MLRQVYSRPIATLLFALTAGIGLGSQLPGYTVGFMLVVFVSAGLTGFGILCCKPARWAPVMLFAALGYTSIQPWVSPNLSSDHIQSFSDETRWQVTGVVGSQPDEFRNLKKFILLADTLEHKKMSYPVNGKIRVTVRGHGPVIAKGDRVVFRSRLRQTRNFNNPGGFNYQRYMAFKGIWRTAYTQGQRLHVVQKKSSKDLSDRFNDARRAMAALIERADQGPSAAVLKALIVGDRTAISSTLRDKFNRAGVGHILAISGLHIGIVATVAFVLFQRLFAFWRPLLWRAWSRKGAAIFSLFPVWIYGLLSGMSPSTQRAVIMVCAFLLTFVVERERDGFNILALAAFIILIVYPPSLFSISFQLSFMAVLSILYGLSRTRQVRPGGKRSAAIGFGLRLRRKMIAFLLVSFFAICGTLPLVMLYFNQISLIGLPANFIVVPLVGFGVIPCGLLALFVYPISSQLAFVGVKICIFVLDAVIKVITFLADLPFAALKTFTPSMLEIVCYYLLGWALLSRLTTESTRSDTTPFSSAPTDIGPPQARYWRYLGRFDLNRLLSGLTAIGGWLSARLAGRKSAIVGLGAALVLVADAGYWMSQRYWNSDLRVTYMDVGQGNAALLELPGGYTALIDGGGFSDNSAFDMGARVIAPFLLRKKIRTVDSLVLSHPNSDHLNGLIHIAEHFNVKTIWTNGETRTTSGYRQFRKIIRRRHLFQPDLEQMSRQQLINGVEFCFLYPPADFLAQKTIDKWRSTNNNSLVLKVSYGKISFLFPGDILAQAEKEVVELAGADLASDVLLVPHHGSRSSSSQAFLSRVQPDIAVISAGWKNRFRLPHSTVLKAYQKNGCRIFRTDRHGAIVMQTDGNLLTIKPFLLATDRP